MTDALGTSPHPCIQIPSHPTLANLHVILFLLLLLLLLFLIFFLLLLTFSLLIFLFLLLFHHLQLLFLVLIIFLFLFPFRYFLFPKLFQLSHHHSYFPSSICRPVRLHFLLCEHFLSHSNLCSIGRSHFLSYRISLPQCVLGASILQGELCGVATPRYWAGGRGGRREGRVYGLRNIIISYHVQEVCSKVVTFEDKYNNLPRGSCKSSIFAWKIDFFVKLPEKIKIFRKFACKIDIF